MQLAAGGMCGGHGVERVEFALGLASISGERAVLQFGSPLADTDRPSQMIADFGHGHGVTAVGGISDVAQHMGKADLMVFPRSCWQA